MCIRDRRRVRGHFKKKQMKLIIFLLFCIALCIASSSFSNAKAAKDVFISQVIKEKNLENFVKDIKISKYDNAVRQLNAIEIEEYYLVVELSELPTNQNELPRNLGIVVIRYIIVSDDSKDAEDKDMKREIEQLSHYGDNNYTDHNHIHHRRHSSFEILLVAMPLSFLILSVCCCACRRRCKRRCNYHCKRRCQKGAQDEGDFEMSSISSDTQTSENDNENGTQLPVPGFQPYYYVPLSYISQPYPAASAPGTPYIVPATTVVQMPQVTEEEYNKQLQAQYRYLHSE
eukprot:TRINITY_DN3863_c0_g1_i1.p1 TRINITY_DN3863_c0_g1~~TRINITY_DN3863_c0_g1_i1.p1  ORF type:complete len:287 (-),score=41.06 TRINITY_DN3863_c0_g1_i1:92-952(-)